MFESVGGWFPDVATITGLAEPERAVTLLVTFGMLQSLGVAPLLGRWLSQEDDTPGAPETLLLSYGYWQRRFGGDPGIIGRTITVDSRPRQIIGVMPQSFRFMHWNPEELYIPLRFERNRLHLGDLSLQGIARLKPGVGLAEANSDIARMLPIWLRSWPAPNGASKEMFEKARFDPALRPLKQAVVGSIQSVLWLIMGTVAVVLVIACVNVANLLLVKAESRQQERGIRMALGASVPQLLRDALAESLLLGAVGGLLALALAYSGLRLLRFIAPANLPRLDDISIDASVLLFALVVSLLSCLLFGLIPALKYARTPLAPALGTGGRSAGPSRERHRAQNLLVVGQVSLALVLLVASGLMIRTFQEIRRVQPGFTGPDQVQTFRIAIPSSLVGEPERVIRMQNDILERLDAIPGVSAAGLASFLPMEGVTNGNPIFAENTRNETGQDPTPRTFKYVSPGFLRAIGTRLIAGRELGWADIHGNRSVVMVSENLARELWGSSSAAIGKRIHELSGKAQWREVVGVVENVHDNGAQKQSTKTVYWPFAIENFAGEPLSIQRDVAVAVRSPRAGTEALLKQIRKAVGSVSPNLPLARVRTLQQMYEVSMAQTSFTLVILAIAGSMALVLGLVGVYSVIAYTVAQRRREVGIRMALGAQAASVKGMFLRNGLLLTGVGIALGLVAAAALSRLMSSFLFGVAPFDPATYGATATVLLAASMAAIWIPARRAAAIDPMETLRGE
jgi:predicted permease